MLLKSHLRHFGAAGEGGAAMGGQSSGSGDVLVGLASSWISVKVHSLPVPEQRELDSRTGQMLQLSLMEVLGCFGDCVEQLNLQG